jgi:hypothetical protein
VCVGGGGYMQRRGKATTEQLHVDDGASTVQVTLMTCGRTCPCLQGCCAGRWPASLESSRGPG